MSCTAAMEKGRVRYVEEQRERARERVRVWQEWNRAHGPLLEMPPVPSDTDFAIAEGRR